MAKFFTKTIVIFLTLFGLSPLLVSAATLTFSPQSGSQTVGSTFSVSVYTNSSDQAMNAASGVISFPADKLEVVSVSKTGSIFSLWVQDPSFSNDSGTVTFEGIVLNPGFTGSNGKIVTVTFRAKSTGNANLSFSSGSVLANDGSGTDILSTLGTADFSLVGGGVPVVTPAEPQAPQATNGLPIAPEVTSSTHPDPTKWYQNSSPDLSWGLPSDVTSVQTLVGSRPDSAPTVSYSPPISEKKIDNLSDGAWYFHIRFANSNGFGETTHFGIKIDTEKPESFDITESPNTDPTDPTVSFNFDAKDKTSGIDHYEISMDGKDSVWNDNGSHTYTTAILSPGTHTMIAKAVDKAGNSRANSVDFTITPLTTPIIDDYPQEVQVGDPIVVDGHTDYKSANVTLFLALGKAAPDTYDVKTDDNGKFTDTLDKKVKGGVYTLWAITTDSRGAQSEASSKVTISIKSSSLLTIGSLVVNVLTVLIPLIALVILLILLLLWSWRRFILSRERLRRDVHNVETGLHKAFNLLRDDIHEQIKTLEKVRAKRKLTEEEENIIDRFKKNLDDVEEFVDKEMKGIKEEVR